MDKIEAHFAAARRARWYSNGGPCLELLTERLAERTRRHCVPLSSGTSALTISVAALRRRTSGDQALVPSFTFAATVQSLLWNQLTPVLVDIAPGHLHLDVDALSEALAARRDRVALVVAGSSFGTPPPPAVRRGWEEVCRQAGVPLIVDSAAGFGARAEDGVPVGAQGDAEVVSFHVTKPFGIGEGGAVFTADPAMAADVRRLANFDFDPARRALSGWGTNGKLDELHAAVGLAVLEDFDAVLATRRRLADRLLAGIGPGLAPQAGHEYGTHQFVPVLAAEDALRDRILTVAAGRVELRTYYDPLHRMPAFEGLQRASDLATTESVSRRILSLPMANDLSEAEIDVIAAVCNEAVTS